MNSAAGADTSIIMLLSLAGLLHLIMLQMHAWGIYAEHTTGK